MHSGCTVRDALPGLPVQGRQAASWCCAFGPTGFGRAPVARNSGSREDVEKVRMNGLSARGVYGRSSREENVTGISRSPSAVCPSGGGRSVSCGPSGCASATGSHSTVAFSADSFELLPSFLTPSEKQLRPSIIAQRAGGVNTDFCAPKQQLDVWPNSGIARQR